MTSSRAAPKLCFVGPMLGHTATHITSQGYVLSELFREAGYRTLSTSGFLNPYARLADIVATLIGRRREIDIALIEVYSGRAFMVADVASAVGRSMGYKIILALHGGNLPNFVKRHPGWTRRVLSRAHALVAPSEYLAETARGLGLPVVIIPNVIDLNCYPHRHRESVRPNLFWMRSFHPIYNPALGLKVLAGLRAEYPDASLTMAGQDKGLAAKMKMLAHSLGIGHAVRFPGFLTNANKVREAEACDIYLNTNRVDNVSVALLEAAAMGLPVVATRIGGLPYLLEDGETGLLVPDDDAAAMISAIRRLLTEPGLAGRLSANGRALAERSGWSSVQRRWLDLFERVS